mgnify:CR=1 FL=1
MGTTVTYRDIEDGNHRRTRVDVTPDRHEFTHEGGRARYVVKSYIEKTAKGVTRLEAAPWKVTGYSLDNGKTWNTDKPHWLELQTTDMEIQAATGTEATRRYLMMPQSAPRAR